MGREVLVRAPLFFFIVSCSCTLLKNRYCCTFLIQSFGQICIHFMQREKYEYDIRSRRSDDFEVGVEALADDFIHHHGGSHTHVERTDMTKHRDRDFCVAEFQYIG